MTSVSRSQKELQLQIASAQESIAESQTCNHREAVLSNGKITANMNLKKINQINTDLATTLCARDYKGFGTGFNTMNGVIEW